MQISKPIVFCALILGILSTTQVGAFARGGGHRGHVGGGDFTAAGGQHSDPSKYHNVLSHPEEADRSSDFTAGSGFDASSGLKEKGPEMVSVDDDIGTGVSLGPAHEDDVGIAHPESKTQKKQEPKSAKECKSSGTNPYGCT